MAAGDTRAFSGYPLKKILAISSLSDYSLGPFLDSESVRTLISQHRLRHFDGPDITVMGKDRWAVTTMEGLVVDQAALQGMLQQHYTLGLVLLSVRRLEEIK